MNLRCLPCLLILLLSSAYLDDDWAAATADPADDAAAAENNVYLRPAPRQQSIRQADLLAGGPSPRAAPPPREAPGRAPRALAPAELFDPPLLYALMSLRR